MHVYVRDPYDETWVALDDNSRVKLAMDRIVVELANCGDYMVPDKITLTYYDVTPSERVDYLLIRE